MNIFSKIPFFKRLIPSVLKRYAFAFSDYQREINHEDIIFNLDIRYLIDRSFYINREYEEKYFWDLVNEITKENSGYFFDIGACWGIYSLRLAKKFNNLKVKAIEPIRKNVLRINNSIDKNNFTNIQVFHSAIGDQNGSIELGTNSDWSPNYEINKKNVEVVEKSSIKTLDNLFDLDNQKIVMKIDVEGFEFEALCGAKNILTKNKCYLQVEIRYENYNRVKKLLHEFGYENSNDIKPLIVNDYADCIFKNY
ncbi:FkbM family methyltransferase [Pelagibacteraceae bacterium]|nr:FkbM family methyltransferase [Pelagibacteraceae bacterium]